MSVVYYGAPVSSTNKADPSDVAEILLTVALNTIKLNQKLYNNKNER
jgi:hypothetical protein